MPRISSNDMVHNHYIDEARKKTQERDRNSKTSLIPSARFQSTADGKVIRLLHKQRLTVNPHSSKCRYLIFLNAQNLDGKNLRSMVAERLISRNHCQVVSRCDTGKWRQFSSVLTQFRPQSYNVIWTFEHRQFKPRSSMSRMFRRQITSVCPVPTMLNVRTRRQLETDGEMCMFALTVSRTEPKNIKEAMADSAWIESMQEELHQFERLDVWELVDRPLCKNVINLKWLWKNKRDEENMFFGYTPQNSRPCELLGYLKREGMIRRVLTCCSVGSV
ncbi:hypothetical protein Tco_0820476 [Tanacetum coccineum]|uniref:Gag-Pol polyprotein n=1 Tax=Tanacetum coccineum TaxID=301880 RepID=A0ABQ5ACM3_9ASTR